MPIRSKTANMSGAISRNAGSKGGVTPIWATLATAVSPAGFGDRATSDGGGVAGLPSVGVGDVVAGPGGVKKTPA
jgi:hypothetical protein